MWATKRLAPRQGKKAKDPNMQVILLDTSDGPIKIVTLYRSGGAVRIGIDAPKSVNIKRGEEVRIGIDAPKSVNIKRGEEE